MIKTWESLTFDADPLHLAMLDRIELLTKQRDNARAELAQATLPERIKIFLLVKTLEKIASSEGMDEWLEKQHAEGNTLCNCVDWYTHVAEEALALCRPTDQW